MDKQNSLIQGELLATSPCSGLLNTYHRYDFTLLLNSQHKFLSLSWAAVHFVIRACFGALDLCVGDRSMRGAVSFFEINRNERNRERHNVQETNATQTTSPSGRWQAKLYFTPQPSAIWSVPCKALALIINSPTTTIVKR